MISKNTIQEIQNHTEIDDVVGAFVRLKRRGSNLLGLCPFHHEKSPSFTVSKAKGIYKCFGCGKSGNAIGFLMELEKYSYVDALRWLANRYNITIEETEVSPEVRLQQQSADSLFVINTFAQKYFSDALFESEEGRDIALSYLKERGFREDIIRKFQLGYDPLDGAMFANAALKNQFNPELLQKSGLTVMRDNGLRDNYRGRIIFPIHNPGGKVLGFGARVIKTNDRAPKYINTPENDIYVKSKILYGAYFARVAIDKADECLLVEGYTDVVSLHQAGVENVVASGGTSLTMDQLRLIKKYTDNLTIIYDGDSAGIKAAMRGMDLALEEGLNVKLVLIPDKEDPDSYVHKIGASAFTEFVQANRQDVVLFQLSLSLQEAGNDSKKKSEIVNRIAETVSRITKAEHFTRRQDYVKQVAEILKIEEAGFNDLVNKFIREKVQKEQGREYGKSFEQDVPAQPEAEAGDNNAETLSLLAKDEMQERAIVRSLIEFGLKDWDEKETVAEHFFREMEEAELESMIDNPRLLKVIDMYRQSYRDGNSPTDQDFFSSDDAELSSLVISLMDSRTEISERWSKLYEGRIVTREDYFREEMTSTLTYFKLRKLMRMIGENQRDLEKATKYEDMVECMRVQLMLKEQEKALTSAVGTVIFR